MERIRIGGELVQVSVSADGKHVWGINSNNKIYYRNDVENNNNWNLVDGSLKYISVSGDGSHYGDK